jgi:hypothetical protein
MAPTAASYGITVFPPIFTHKAAHANHLNLNLTLITTLLQNLRSDNPITLSLDLPGVPGCKSQMARAEINAFWHT